MNHENNKIKNKNEKYNLSDLYYEIKMFRCMYSELQKANDFPQKIRNAFLESFLVHTRILIDFFQGTKHEDDIQKSSFKNNNGDNLSDVKEWNITQDDKIKINKKLSHLSKIRSRVNNDWSKDIVKFEKEIEREINKFLEEISDIYFPFLKGNEIIEKKNFGKSEIKNNNISKEKNNSSFTIITNTCSNF